MQCKAVYCEMRMHRPPNARKSRKLTRLAWRAVRRMRSALQMSSLTSQASSIDHKLLLLARSGASLFASESDSDALADFEAVHVLDTEQPTLARVQPDVSICAEPLTQSQRFALPLTLCRSAQQYRLSPSRATRQPTPQHERRYGNTQRAACMTPGAGRPAGPVHSAVAQALARHRPNARRRH